MQETEGYVAPEGAPVAPKEGENAPQQQPGVGVPAPFQSASLYVGDLHPSVTGTLLYDIFNAVGPVASTRVCRDAITRRSLGYAYVNFHNPSDAERALDTMNYTLIKGRPCRMMWSQRDPALRKNGSGNVFVKHLDPSIDNKALYDTFSLFGNILSCKVVVDETGKSRGYGFVHFETTESANKAIKKINGMLLAGKEVFVGKFLKRGERPVAREWTNLYFRNIPKYYTEEDIKSLFGVHGEISSTTIMKDTEGVSRGFGFVDFVEHASAVEAIEKLNEFELKGKPEEEKEKENGDENSGEAAGPRIYKLEVFRAQKKSERVKELTEKFQEMKMERQQKYQGVNLYVKNLDDKVDDEKLAAEFAPFGTITSARVMKSGDVSKGFGFVCFSSTEEAIRAAQEMNGVLVAGKPIYVALAQRKETRKVQLEAQHRVQQRMMMLGPNVGGMNGMMPQGQVPGMPPNQAGMNPNMMMMPPQQQMGPGQVPMNYYNMPGMMPAQMQAQMPDMAGSEQMPMGPVAGLDPAMLAAQEPNARKRLIGEKLYPLVQRLSPAFAPKITGMLLEFDNAELLQMMHNPELLAAKVQEAADILPGNMM